MEKKFYTEEEALNLVLGKKGNPLRDDYEDEMRSFLMGEAIRKARTAKKMTQEELGERMGVKRAQVSRIEKGRNLTFSTISRAFRALEVPASFQMEGLGTVPIWK